MATLNIGGKQVQVSDAFTSMSPEEQQRVVDEIASGFSTSLPAAATPEPQRGSFLDPLAQGATLGFSDEIAGVGSASLNSIKGLFGGGNDQSFGDNYRSARDDARGDLEAFRSRNPGTALASELAGGLLTGGAGAARTGALKAGQLLKPKLDRAAATGAGLGGIYGAGESDADLLDGDLEGVLKDSAASAGFGGAAGIALPALGHGIAKKLRNGSDKLTKPDNGILAGAEATKKLTDNYTKDVNLLRKAGIPLTTGQRSGSEMTKAYESTLQNTTGGGALNRVFEEQQQHFQRKLLAMAGADDKLTAAGVITEDVLDDLSGQLSSKYKQLLGDKTITLGDDFVDTLAATEAKHSEFVTAQQRREIRTLVDDFLGDATAGSISGERYQRLRSLMGRRARQNQLNNAPLSDLFKDLQRGLDDAFTSSVGGDNKALNAQYAHYKQLQDVWRRSGSAGVAQGTLPLAALNRMAKNKPSSKDWRELINAGAAVLPGTTANSGTATRQSLLRTLGALGTGGLSDAAATGGRYLSARGLSQGADVPGVVGRGMRHTAAGAEGLLNFSGSAGLPVAVTPGFLAEPPLPPTPSAPTRTPYGLLVRTGG